MAVARRRLKTIEDVRRYVAYLINATEGGEIDAQMAGKLGYLANILKACILDGDLEARVKALEEKANGSGSLRPGPAV